MQRFIAEIKRRRVIPVAAYYLIGTWLALQGENGKAVDSIQTAYDQGFRQVYTAEGQLPLPLEMLAGDPRFDRLLEKIDADLGVMRERAITLVESR